MWGSLEGLGGEPVVCGQNVMWGWRRCVPSVIHPTLCPGRRGKAGWLFIGRCRPLQIQEHSGQRAWFQNPNWREMDFCRERRQPHSRVCTWAKGEAYLAGRSPRSQRRAPSVSLQLRDPKLREEGEGQCRLVFEELERLSANRGLLPVTAALSLGAFQGVWRYLGRMKHGVHI